MDREKVIKGLEQFKADLKPFCGNRADWERFDAGISLLKEQGKRKFLIDEQGNITPLPEIVRCKDCIYGDDFDCPAPLPTGYVCQKGYGSHTGDWFCADGGKR